MSSIASDLSSLCEIFLAVCGASFDSNAVAVTGCMWFNHDAIVETSNKLKEIDIE